MSDRVPELRELPPGLVLDGELVAFNDADDPEPTAAGEHGPAHAAAATYVRDLQGSSLAPLLNRIGSSYPGTGTLTPAWFASTGLSHFRLPPSWLRRPSLWCPNLPVDPRFADPASGTHVHPTKETS